MASSDKATHFLLGIMIFMQLVAKAEVFGNF